MPEKIRKLKSGKFQVRTNGIKAEGTTKAKAEAQVRLLRGIEAGTFKPTGKPISERFKKKKQSSHNPINKTNEDTFQRLGKR